MSAMSFVPFGQRREFLFELVFRRLFRFCGTLAIRQLFSALSSFLPRSTDKFVRLHCDGGVVPVFRLHPYKH